MISILQKLADRAKMDWFYVDINGQVRDLQNGGKVISIERAMHDILEGVTEWDLEVLTKEERSKLCL